ncbi:class I SAM-dependent methyltransferase [Erythrobacter arachoides]|uniref:Class I SAM-dependent methyltransferase n=1 Tax=Aurantiacibacter arachoides TaxID=1850444 RepID=A0A844ZZ53_9SPHN|nr:class I SAM-dependent methyltransferase [Aurantiacibacter arachoides]MXO93561.1 class I SAM-dependent methyltransferase [Aurantiacibacter arachoides]GGD48430.1 hypothetical protein GCM10011411_05200 [Aurantiacibacter arachoides]
MTSRHTTQFRTLDDGEQSVAVPRRSWTDTAWRIGFGAIGWPWLAMSLWGGTKASKRALLKRVGLADDALPNLGSWKADTGFLHRIVDAVEELRPQVVVELGAGASTLVCARALALNGGGQLYSFDQHAGFVDATRNWLREEGASARLQHAPLRAEIPGWSGTWYDLPEVPAQIDLLIIDGPPWTVHPTIRGAAESLFDRLSPGAIVLLDDAARPGERIVARRWRSNWPQMRFERVSGSTKGTLVGHRLRSAEVLPFRASRGSAPLAGWKRAAMVAAAFGAGWLANDLGVSTQPASAANFIAEADASFDASEARRRMASQVDSALLDRTEIERATGIALPAVPSGWRVEDVQVFPSDLGVSVAVAFRTGEGESFSLFATRAETPAERLPLLTRQDGRSLAYWEEGPFAFALSGEMHAEAVLRQAAVLASR